MGGACLLVGVKAGVAGVPVVAVESDAERELILRYELQRVVEVLVCPEPAIDRAGDGPASTLVVGHEADEVDGFGESFEIVAAAPLLEDPGAEGCFAGMAGSVGDDVDLDLQVLLVEGVGGLF